jgi:ubiquinone/menaquinone biosynthesis C-methylase UbiE
MEEIMPIQPNFLERTAFFTLNAAPAPMLDMAGALAFQVVSTAVHLNIFNILHEQPSTLPELTQTLNCQKRGLQKLLTALVSIGYVKEKNGRYQNTTMTEKWFLDGAVLDLNAAVTCWGTFLQELWPHAPEVVQNGERPFNFYDFIGSNPVLSHNFQQMMVGNANIMAPDIVKQLDIPQVNGRLLDVGGGHGMFTIHLCQANPNLQATIVDSAVALETAKQHIAAHQLENRVELIAADIWQMDWIQDYDLVMLFNFIHHYDIVTNKALLQKAKAALKPQGRVAILDQLEGNISGSATNALIQLIGFMYYLFADGRTFSKEEVTDMLQETGFEDLQFHTSAKWAGTSLVTAVRK